MSSAAASNVKFYKITRDQLQYYGIDAATVNPKTIKIYNNGGFVLSENVLMPRPDDLEEIAITISGEDDGKFDAGDFITFYGRGTAFWYYDTLGRQMMRNQNVYSAKNYYWITTGGANGKRTTTKQASSDPTSNILDKVEDILSGMNFHNQLKPVFIRKNLRGLSPVLLHITVIGL